MRAGEQISGVAGAWHARNVGTAERMISTATGGLLAARGLRRGGLSGVLMAVAGAAMVKRGVSGYCPVRARMEKGKGLQGWVLGHGREARPSDYFKHGVRVEEAVTVQAPVGQVYAFWRDFGNLAKFMEHVKRVDVIDEKKSHWVVAGPANKSLEWDAEIINEEEGKLISWKSLAGAEVNNTGTVQFREAAAGRGTEVRVTLEYLPPAGRLGLAVAKMFGKTPGAEVRDDLRRLRQIIETGEVPTTKGQPRGGGKRGHLQTKIVDAVTMRMGAVDELNNAQGRYGRDAGEVSKTDSPAGEQADGPENAKGPQGGSQSGKPRQATAGYPGESREVGGGE